MGSAWHVITRQIRLNQHAGRMPSIGCKKMIRTGAVIERRPFAADGFVDAALECTRSASTFESSLLSSSPLLLSPFIQPRKRPYANTT